MRHDPDRLLEILHSMVCASVRADGPDLTARQMALLLAITLEPVMHTVRGLAARLNISKPAISRSLDRLVDIGLADRAPDPRDRRSVLIVPTVEGRLHVAEMREWLREAASGRSAGPRRPRRNIGDRAPLRVQDREMMAAG